MNRMRQGTRRPHRLFIVPAVIGALIIFIAAEGVPDLQRAHRPFKGKGSLSDSCVKKGKTFNPWNTVLGGKNGE